MTETKQDRYQREFELLGKYDFFGYFGILFDIVNFARKNNIKLISRGSASGSYLWYLAGGSQLDPIEHGLMFERFLAELRLETGELPDIDIDVAASKRHILQEYAIKKYGFCPVGTVTTYSHSSLVRLIDRVWEKQTGRRIEPKVVTDASNADPDNPWDNEAFMSIMNNIPFAKGLYNGRMGARSGYGMHACAVIPLDDDMPVPIEGWTRELVVNESESGSHKTLQSIGYVKYDLLSSDTMDILQNLYELTGVDCPQVIKDGDPCFAQFEEEDVSGLFQFDTPTARNILRLMKKYNRKIDGIHILAALTSAGRPGPMEAGFHEMYARGDADLSTHPQFIREIFQRTGGVILYQEQVAELFAKVAFKEYNKESREYGIVALKALVPKNQKVAESDKFKKQYKELHDMFMRGALDHHKLDEEYAESVFKSLDGFIRYGFNLSHALSYANASAQMAWYKYNYPSEYWTVLLNKLKNSGDDREKVLRYIVDSTASHNMQFVPPHVNIATNSYILENNKIYCPISMVIGLGEKVMNSIVDERERGGKFKSLQDFNERVKINKSLKLKLYNAGMLEGLDGTLYDLGALDYKHYSVRGQVWQDIPVIGTVVDTIIIDGEVKEIVLDNGDSYKFTIAATPNMENKMKELGVKLTGNGDDILPNTTIKLIHEDGYVINYKRVFYVEPDPPKMSLLHGIREALGFALPENLGTIIRKVLEQDDQRIGYVTEIFTNVSASGSELLKVTLSNGERYWGVLDDQSKNNFLTMNRDGSRKVLYSLEDLRSIKEGDLLRVQLLYFQDRDTNEPKTIGQMRYFKVLA